MLILANFRCIIFQNMIIKGDEEDEQAAPGRYREQGQVRACPSRTAEWTLELQGERYCQ